MSDELGFEPLPFGFQGLAAQESGSELEEEFGRRGRAQLRSTRPAPRPRLGKAPQPSTAATLATPKFSAFASANVRRHWPRRPWLAPGPYGVGPYPIEAEPYPVAPAQRGSEYTRWVQSALNSVLGLQLPVNGIMDTATRDAIRSFQQQQGIPDDGVVGPDTERALLAARAQQPQPGGPTAPPAPVEPPAAAPAAELNFESLERELENGRASTERAAVKKWIRAGLRDRNALADLVFFRRYPELRGRRIGGGDRALAAEWNAILRTIVLPTLASAGAAGAGAKVEDREFAQTLAMAATPVPNLRITLEQLLLRHEVEAGGIPIEVLLAFIHFEAGRLFNDATAGKWNERQKKYIPPFYELGVFQTPAGHHGCVNEAGVKTCKYPPPGRNVENSQFGKGWRHLSGAYPTATNWKDPTMQVRVGLWDLVTTADRVRSAFPDLFPSNRSGWWLRMAVLYAFAAGGGAARAFLRKYTTELLALPETERWGFLRGKSVGSFSFDPTNVDKKMELAAKLRKFRRVAAA